MTEPMHVVSHTRRSVGRRAAGAALAGALAVAAGVSDTGGAATRSPSASAAYPKAGVIVWTHVAARAAPSRSARIVKTLRQFRSDFRPTTVLAVGERRDAKGIRWVRVSLPMRPNGRFGWVKSAALELRPVRKRIVIDRSSRTLVMFQGRRRVLSTRVAIGRANTPTPLGRFYIQASYRGREHWLGAHAFETSAYSSLSEWPGGGVVGIHGTPWPHLLGKAVSHGCIRISNRAAIRLRRLAAPGTPVVIRQ